MTRGFITIATGKEEYYQLARNLLHSYRHFCKKPLPFAILADRENEYTAEFDDVIIFPDGASNSYLDKLSLGKFAPYDITIFIDADCLAYDDLNVLFDHFEKADDFSCFGRVLPLDDKTGWFEYENLGELQEKVSYIVGLHGGLYYMRKGDITQKIFEDAKGFIPEYQKYKFRGKFELGDEPLVALSMAVNDCRPIPFVKEAICCYWEHVGGMQMDITKGKATVGGEYDTVLLHWGTRFTRELKYRKQVALLDILETSSDNLEKRIAKCTARYDRLMRQERMKRFVIRVKNKILRTLGIRK
jgi:hypothetical protein